MSLKLVFKDKFYSANILNFMLFITGKSYKLIHKYTNALNKVQLMTSINFVHVSVQGGNSQGIL